MTRLKIITKALLIAASLVLVFSQASIAKPRAPSVAI